MRFGWSLAVTAFKDKMNHLVMVQILHNISVVIDIVLMQSVVSNAEVPHNWTHLVTPERQLLPLKLIASNHAKRIKRKYRLTNAPWIVAAPSAALSTYVKTFVAFAVWLRAKRKIDFFKCESVHRDKVGCRRQFSISNVKERFDVHETAVQYAFGHHRCRVVQKCATEVLSNVHADQNFHVAVANAGACEVKLKQTRAFVVNSLMRIDQLC